MRNHRRIIVCAFLFTLTAIFYADRVALSVAATPIAKEFGRAAPIVTGYFVQIKGRFDNAVFISGFLPLFGALATLTMTRTAISPDRLGAAVV